MRTDLQINRLTDLQINRLTSLRIFIGLWMHPIGEFEDLPAEAAAQAGLKV